MSFGRTPEPGAARRPASACGRKATIRVARLSGRGGGVGFPLRLRGGIAAGATVAGPPVRRSPRRRPPARHRPPPPLRPPPRRAEATPARRRRCRPRPLPVPGAAGCTRALTPVAAGPTSRRARRRSADIPLPTRPFTIPSRAPRSIRRPPASPGERHPGRSPSRSPDAFSAFPYPVPTRTVAAPRRIPIETSLILSPTTKRGHESGTRSRRRISSASPVPGFRHPHARRYASTAPSGW